MEKIVCGEKSNCDYRRTCYGIVQNNNKYLIAYNEGINEYSLAGGGVENGESLEDCIVREFSEEVGYNIIKIREFVNIDCFWIKRDGRKMETDAYFFLVDVDLTNNFTPTEKGHKALWVEEDFLLGHIEFPYQRKALEIFFDKFHKI